MAQTDVRKLIEEALELDSAGRASAAYSKYLECVINLARKLEEGKQDINSQCISVKNSTRLFKLLHHCVDRAEAVLAAASADGISSALSDSSSTTNTNHIERRRSDSASSNPVSMRSNSAPSISSDTDSTAGSEKDETKQLERLAMQPILDAQRKNKELLRSYQRQLGMLSGQARSSMQTSLMRTMVENMQIAETQRQQESEQEVLKRIEDRKKWEEDRETNRRNLIEHKTKTSSSGRLTLAASMEGLVALVERISSQMAILDQRSKKVRELDFAIRKLSLTDDEQIFDYILAIFQTPDHPLSQHLCEFTESFREYYSEKTLQLAHAKRDDIKEMLMKVQQELHSYTFYAHKALLNTYPELGVDFIIRSSIIAIEDSLFSQIYPTVFELYRLYYREQDKAITDQMILMANCTPEEAGIKSKFWLLPQTDEEFEPENTPPPYQKAIDILTKITSAATPSEKALCVVKTTQAICQCVSEYWSVRGLDTSTKESFAIGADDLLPIFCYVIIKTNPPCLRSQCTYVTEFINEHLVNGEEGYAAATLDTTLQLLEKMAVDHLRTSTKF